MAEMAANDDRKCFGTDPGKYADYLETPEGRLRLDLAFANLQDLLPRATPGLQVLDIGCGTGGLGVRLAQLGAHVTLLDSSQQMLELAERTLHEASIRDQTTLKHGDAAQVADLFHDRSFDLILCHNVLEYVDDSSAVIRGAARLLRESDSMISILVRNQAGEVLKSAIKDGDLAAAEHNLTAEWGRESLYGGRVRLFTAGSLQSLLESTSLAIIAERGVRVISDYLPQKVSRNDEYQNIFELERKLSSRPEFISIARYRHCVARRASPMMQESG